MTAKILSSSLWGSPHLFVALAAEVLGHTGNVYDVRIGQPLTCLRVAAYELRVFGFRVHLLVVSRVYRGI